MNKSFEEVLKINIFFRSSRPEVFCKKSVQNFFSKFKRKHLYRSPFFNKVHLLFYKQFWNSFSVNLQNTTLHKWFCFQALTNQFLSNVRSRTPVSKYFFVYVLSNQNTCMCCWSKKYLICFFIGIVFFWVSRSVLMVFLISALYCACNMLKIVEST